MKLKKELKLPKAATLEGIHNEKEVWHQYTIRALGKKKKTKKTTLCREFSTKQLQNTTTSFGYVQQFH